MSPAERDDERRAVDAAEARVFCLLAHFTPEQRAEILTRVKARLDGADMRSAVLELTRPAPEGGNG